MTGRPMLSAREIAAAIGVNKRAVQLRADRGEWAHVVQAHTNGRPIKLYEVARLPAEIREEIARRSLAATSEAPKPIVPAAPIDTTPAADWQRRCADARAALLAELDRLAETHGVNRAVEAMVSAAADGTLAPVLAELVPAANARAGSDGGRTLSPRTLKRWRAARAAGGWAGLLPQATAADPDEPAWAAEFMKLYRRPSKPTIAMCLREMAKSRPTGIDMPSYDQVRRHLAKVAPVVKEAGRMGPMALLAVQGHKRRTTEGLQPMDVVTADGHTFKGLVQHPIHGRPFAPELCAIMDVATRCVVGWSAGLAESAWVVLDAIRHTVERHGMFAILHTDNGSGLVNEALSDARAMGILARLGVTHERSQPGRAQSRGKIERLQGTLWKTAARSLVTYRGADMDREASKRIGQRIERDMRERGASRYVMAWDEFLEWAGTQVDDYNTRPHRALRRIKDPLTGAMRHMTPAEAIAERQAEGWAPTLLPATLSQDLMRPYEERTTRRGEVVMPWGRYYAPQLEAYHGQRVTVGYDIHDGERAWVRDLSGRLIAVAIRDGNVIPEQPASKVEHALRKRAATRLDRIEKHREEAAAELASPVLEGRAQPAAPAGDLPRITSIPAARPAASAVLPPARPKRPAELPPIVEKLRSEGVIDLRPTGAARDVTERAERIGRAIEIEDRVAAGQAVDDADLTWLEGYRRTAEYRSGVSFERERRAFMGAAAAQ